MQTKVCVLIGNFLAHFQHHRVWLGCHLYNVNKLYNQKLVCFVHQVYFLANRTLQWPQDTSIGYFFSLNHSLLALLFGTYFIMALEAGFHHLVVIPEYRELLKHPANCKALDLGLL